MPITTFWSNNKETIGQTVSAASMATEMAIEHNYRVLLISADFNNTTMLDCFGAQESNKEILKGLIRKPQINLDSGINGLLKMASSNRVTPEIIHDYTKIVYENRLEVLYSPTDINENDKKATMERMKNIIMNAARYYDQVIVDLRKGLETSEQLEILALSDVIVFNINQRMDRITEALQIKEMNGLYDRVVWNICKYDKNSKCNTKNLLRTVLKRQTICETPYNTLIYDACGDGKIAEMLLNFRTLIDEDENLTFINKIKELQEAVLLKYQERRSRL